MSNITMTNTDPGEGSPLEKDEYVAVYGDGGKFTEDDIADNAISTSKIKNGAVNKEKLASDAIYVLPTASETTLGGIKVGKNLAIDDSGVLSASAEPYNLPTASNTTLGGVKVGNNLKIDGQGVLSAEAGGAQISVTNVDPGEGEPLDENNYVAVYGEDSLIKGEDIAKNTVTSDNIDWTTIPKIIAVGTINVTNVPNSDAGGKDATQSIPTQRDTQYEVFYSPIDNNAWTIEAAAISTKSKAANNFVCNVCNAGSQPHNYTFAYIVIHH